jgi:hypothetical protein
MGCFLGKGCWFAVLMTCVCLTGCAENDRVPLSPRDRDRLDLGFSAGISWTPRLTQKIDGRLVILGVVLFDGTENNRLNVPADERETIVGHIDRKLRGNQSLAFLDYYPGVGTETQPIKAAVDAATGYTIKGVVNQAVDKTILKIDAARQEKPDADVRLFVAGFSRGGAAARHFMNVLAQRWRMPGHIGSSPRFYALIFDTVATGQRTQLMLQVPTSADIFYHFVSIDERRILFKPVIDVSQDPAPGRIVTARMPGVHSDIGTSYTKGVGSEYMANVDALLASMELIPQQCFVVDGDARAEGKNDSRWVLERFLGIGAPNTPEEPESRSVVYVKAEPVPEDFWPGWQARMLALQLKDQISILRCTSRQEVWMPEFNVSRIKDDSFEVHSLPPFNLPSARIVDEDGHHFMTYIMDGTTLSRISISKSLLDGITSDRSVRLSLSVEMDADGGEHFWWFLNDVRVEEVAGTFRPNTASQR